MTTIPTLSKDSFFKYLQNHIEGTFEDCLSCEANDYSVNDLHYREDGVDVIELQCNCCHTKASIENTMTMITLSN